MCGNAKKGLIYFLLASSDNCSVFEIVKIHLIATILNRRVSYRKVVSVVNMENGHQMYDRSNREEYYTDPQQRILDVSETDLSESETSERRERPSQHRSRLDSYQQAHVSREMLQQMERSYRLNGGMSDSNISLDDKPKTKKKTLIYVIAGLLAIMLIMLVLLLASSALVVYIFWIGFVEFPSSSLQQSAVTPQQLVGYTTQVDELHNEVAHLHEITNVSTLEINALIAQFSELQATVNSNFAMVEAIDALANQLNQLSEITKRNISTVDSQINTVQSEIVILNDHISRLDGQISTIRNDVTTVQGQASGLQTSMNNIDSRLESPVNLYQNCRQDTSVCNITTFRDTRLFCSTMAILREIEVSNREKQNSTWNVIVFCMKDHPIETNLAIIIIIIVP